MELNPHSQLELIPEPVTPDLFHSDVAVDFYQQEKHTLTAEEEELV